MKEERKVIELSLDDILPNRFQPRIRFDEDAINELAESIKEHGVIQPIVVRPIADKYEIIAGERRYKASVLAGKKTIPALITDLNDKESAEIALIENVQRQDLTPIEEAVSYKKILDMGYLTQNQLADKLGKDQSTVANKLRLLNLDDEVQEALLNEKISERHARSLLKIGHKDQRELLHKIIEKRLTVRKTDEEINKILGLTPAKKIEEPKVISENPEPTPNLTEETEVLDLEESLSEQKKEEFMIDENHFNIPESPIINDNPAPMETPTNPGFVDVNKIEETATDLYQEKPTVNINNLLEPSTVPLAEAKEEEEISEIRPGKFFQLFEDEVEETKPEEPVSNQFDFNGFQTEPIMDVPSISEPESTLPTEEVLGQPVMTEVEPISLEETLDLNDISIPETNPTPIMMETGPVTEPDYSFEQDLEPMKEITPVTPLMEATPNHNLMAAVQQLRACADAIEASGFVVDVDEFDFEDMYQVIIKIDKK